MTSMSTMTSMTTITIMSAIAQVVDTPRPSPTSSRRLGARR